MLSSCPSPERQELKMLYYIGYFWIALYSTTTRLILFQDIVLKQKICNECPRWAILQNFAQVRNNPIAAAPMIPTVAQPTVRSILELTRSPITLGSLVSRITSRISGGANTPFNTADQNS